MLRVSEAARGRLPREVVARLSAALPALVESLQERLRENPEWRALLADEQRARRLKSAHLEHWQQILTTRFDAEHEARLTRAGRIHSEAGVEPSLVFGAYGFFLLGLIRALASGRKDPLLEVAATLIARVHEDMKATLMAQWQASCAECRGIQRELQHLALHDPLTGLANRRLFLDRLQHALHYARRERQRVGLLRIDVDNFKGLNDAFGHDVGDRVLARVAERLCQRLRRVDTAARIGGDEFAVVLPGMKSARALQLVAERMLSGMAPPLEISGYRVHVTVSIGGAAFPDHGADRDELLASADHALYVAKRRGRNRYASFRGSSDRRLPNGWLADFEAALENGELGMLFQPQHALDSGELRGFEALLRWRHPRYGEIAPGRFLEAIERSPLMYRLARFSIETVCATARRLEKRFGFKGVFAVNLSQKQVTMPGLVETILDTLKAHALDPERLEVEITEDVIVEDVGAQLRTRLEALQGAGVSIALDDFGTGYASLAHLDRLPFACLKIDRSFVAELANSATARAIARTVVRLGRQLGAAVVAEGIETEEQRSWLRRMQCGFGQGYLFAPPLPESELAACLRAHGRSTSSPPANRAGEPEALLTS